jgi:DNA-directed RNA polymerase specialized sigma24 family protein
VKKDWVLTEEAFERLLKWLAPERDRSAELYEEIRQRLIRILARRGCQNPEDVTDEVFNRVTVKLETVGSNYSGERLPYFIRVAQLVYLESLKSHAPLPINTPVDVTEDGYECLESCLARLTPANRKLILDYYEEEKKIKIDNRKGLADQMNIKPHALRMRIHRIKDALQRCVEKCLEDRGKL